MSPDVDHFKCYRIHNVKIRVPNLLLTDQFGQLVFDVRKPMRFCVAASKNGEGMVHPLARLLCYKGVQLSLPKFRGITPLYLTDQFGAVTTSVDHIRELCLPSSSP